MSLKKQILYNKKKSRAQEGSSQTQYISIYIYCLGPVYPHVGWELSFRNYTRPEKSIKGNRRLYQFYPRSSRGFSRLCRTNKVLTSTSGFLDPEGTFQVGVSIDWNPDYTKLFCSNNFAPNPIVADLAKQQKNEVLTDLLIRCEDGTFKAHRCVLISQSEFFREVLSGKEEFTVGEKGLDLRTFKMRTIRAVLAFLYHEDGFKDLFGVENTAKKCANSDCLKVENEPKSEDEESDLIGLKRKLKFTENSGSLSAKYLRGEVFKSEIVAKRNVKSGNMKNKRVYVLIKLILAADFLRLDDLQKMCEVRILGEMTVKNALRIMVMCLSMNNINKIFYENSNVENTFLVKDEKFVPNISPNSGELESEDSEPAQSIGSLKGFGERKKIDFFMTVIGFIAANIDEFLKRNDFKDFMKNYPDIASIAIRHSRKISSGCTGNIK